MRVIIILSPVLPGQVRRLVKKFNSHNLGGNNKITLFKAKKPLLWAICGVALSLGAITAYAQFFADLYEVRTVKIFPASVEGLGWENLETITFQNLEDYSLLQEFNDINSATIDTSEQYRIRNEERKKEAEAEELEVATDIEGELATSSEALEDEQEVISSTSSPTVPADDVDNFEVANEDSVESEDDSVDEEVTEVEFDLNLDTETVPEPEIVEEVNTSTESSASSDDEALEEDSDSVEEESATTTVLNRVTSVFTLAIEAVTTVFEEATSTENNSETEAEVESAENTEEEISENEEVAAEVAAPEESEEGQSEGTAETPEEESQSEPDESTEEVVDVEEAVDQLEGEVVSATTSEDQAVIEEETTEETKEVEKEAEEEMVLVDCEDDCVPYTIKLSNFGFPLEEGVRVTGAQLRLSFAAKIRETRDAIPLFGVRYSLDGGTNWQSGGTIVIDDEESNSINGGYYLFAIPDLLSEEDLYGLQIELTYEDNPDLLKDLFVESAWLEMFTLEATDEQVETDFAEVLANDGFDEAIPSGDVLRLPDGDELVFDFTDDNEDETLIIKSDELNYAGLTEATTYFSVTNTSNKTENINVQAYFPDNLGEVVSLEVHNPNKPRKVIIPEYRPYVYHCEAGWEATDLEVTDFVPVVSSEAENRTSEDSVEVDEPVDIDFGLPTSTASSSDVNEVEDVLSNNTTTVMRTLPSIAQLLQFSTTSEATTTDSLVLDEIVATSTAEVETIQEGLDEVSNKNYVCKNTNIVRTCDELDGNDTSCRVNQVKVQDHEVTRYAPGWDKVDYAEGSLPQPGIFQRVAEFVGFGPDKKEVPDNFEVRAHTPSGQLIRPGETLYFKMDISFPAFSSGEYWIEAIGGSEYGLLDPFWTSEWTYRMPISVPNNTGADLTEYQIFFELDSSLTDFWTNVNSDGSDIRFIQEMAGNFSDADTAINNWLDFDFTGRVPVEIPALTVDADLTDFPVSVALDSFDSGFWTEVQSDGSDIRVTTSDGTFIPFDLAEIDTAAETGELHFLAPVVAANAANTFYVYYGDTSLSLLASTDPLGSEAVWASYDAVYHFTDDPTTIGNTITDETGNGQDLTVNSVALATTSGQLGTAIDFTAGAGWLASSTWDFSPGSPLNITGSYFMSVLNGEALYQWGTGASPEIIRYEPWYSATNGRFYFGPTATWLNRTYLDPTVWHGFATIGTTTAGDNNYVYEDGFLVDEEVQTINNPSNTSGGFQMGRDGGGGNWQGFVDALRIATVDRVPAWTRAESINLGNPEQFYVARQSQTPNNATSLSWYSTSWEGRQRVTIPAENIPDSLTDYPVYLDLSMLGSEFFTRVASDGRDIRVTSGDGVTELPIELVGIDTGSETGELYFRADLTDSGSNDFYVYFENQDALAYDRADTFGSENVWTNGFQAVYHFEEDASGTGNAELYKDSTVNQYHADDETSSNDNVGRIGGGLELGDSSSDYVTLPYQVLDGVQDVTVSGFYKVPVVSATDERTILSGANAVEDDEFRLQLEFDGSGADEFFWVHSVGTESTALDDGQSWGDDEWDYFMTVGEDATDEFDFYLNGIPDTENPDTQAIDALDIDVNGLVIGQEQTAIGNFQATNEFIGLLDEIRIASTTRTEAWARVEGANLVDPNSFMSTSSAETLQVTEFVELDFWVQHFDDTAEEADIWVQVEELAAGEDTIIWLYYGNSGASSASDELATFSYSTSTDIFYVVDDSGANQVSIVSLIDNNEVAIDGGAAVPLNAGERTTFSTFDGESVISILGPISGTVTNNSSTDGSDTIVPISFATTTHAIPTNRGTEQYYVHAPFASTTLMTYERTTLRETVNIATGTTATVNAGSPAGTDAAIFEATSPVLIMHRGSGGTAQDGLVAYPPTTRDLFGFDSNNYYMTALADNPDPSVFCSGGGSGSETGILQGEYQGGTNCSAGTQFTGDSVRLTGQTEYMTAIQQADSDGNESIVFWPEMEFSTQYALTNDSQFIAVACSPRFGSVNISLVDSTGTEIDSGTCTPTATDPGTLRIGDSNTGTNQGTFYSGEHTVIATNDVPFFLIYEDTEVAGGEDEKNVVGPVQARKFSQIFTSDLLFLPQELANDAEYDQLSFAWYENANQTTPTSSWPLGGAETVAEGDAITGAGAVEDGDILRLRLNLQGSNATGTENSTAFKLQYATAASSQCSLATSWFDIGEQGSTTAAFSGYNNALVPDGTTLSSTTLASSTIFGTYEERNFSDFLPAEVPPGEVIEYDWVLEATNVDINTNYCFRMARAEGAALNSYTLYPELETVGPPNTPDNLLFFDNEKTTVLTPVLEFSATDIAGDDIHYQVQVDTDINFGSVDIDENSDDNFVRFENLDVPSDKSPFTSGQRIRYNANVALSPTTTYWFRVRASDPDGSATSSDWSVPTSFTTDTVITVSEWYQTTSDQFNTNELTNVSTTSPSGSASLSSSPATIIGTAIDFDDATVGNAWGEVDWTDTETSGTNLIQVQYNDNGSWTLVPNSLIPGNDIGTTTAPINLLDLDTDTYNEIRLVANLSGTTVSLQEWTVRWGLRVETPVQGDLFDNQKTADTLPVFDFVSTDPQGDDLEYEVSFSTDILFSSGSTTYNSSTSAQFSNIADGGDSSPYNSGDTITFTTPGGAPFVDGNTYWWRSRARDPQGGNSWSPWSDPDSFTINSGTTLSTWFQTTREQFQQGELTGAIASTTGSVETTNVIGEYGTVALTDNDWTTVSTTNAYVDMVVVASPEFNFNGTNNGRTARVRNKTTESFEIKVDDYTDSFTGSTDVDYIVMEAGDWQVDNGGSGFRIVAGTEEGVTAKQVESYANGVSQLVTISPAFDSAPAALATISSNNDSNWIGSHIDGGGYADEVTVSQIGLALAESRHSASTHTGGEDIDWLMMATTTGTNAGVNIEFNNSPDVVTGGAAGNSFSISGFSSTPGVTVIHNNGDDGAQGGFAQKDTGSTQNNTTLTVSISEQGSTADGHIDNIVSFAAFEDSAGNIVRADTGSLAGTIAGEDIIFSDGAGPKFDNFSWSATEPGASEVLIQMEHLVSEGVYALIPDGQIPGNSSGTSTSPIDLTNVDINLYPQIRAFATLNCSGADCPTLDDWQLEWSEGVNMSGTLQEYDRITNVGAGTIRAAVNGSPVVGSASVSAGTWTLTNVTAFEGDVVTVWVDGALEEDEAVTSFVYDGLGDITGVTLYEQHLTIAADEIGTTTNALLALNDSTALGDEDVFFEVDVSNNLTVCGVGTCPYANLYVGANQIYLPSTSTVATIDTHDFINDGIIELDANVFNVSGSWENNATSSTDISTINLTATSGAETITSLESPLDFHNLSFGSGAGLATFTIATDLDLSGDLTVASGTLDRSTFDINLAGSLTNGSGGFWSGTGTTTFDGGSGLTWTDNNPVTQNIGNVLIDGANAFVTVSGDVSAYDVIIGLNDTLAGGSGTIFVAGDFTNNGTFNAETGTVEIVADDRTYPPITPGSSDWYSDIGFQDRIALVVDEDEVPADVSDLPLYVDLSMLGSEFWTDVKSDGGDIRITEDDGQTELAYELVSFDASNETGELHFLANSISGTASTTFYIYYNNATATAYAVDDPYGRNTVWNDFEAVYHFEDDPTSVSNTISDASGNGNDLLVEGAGLATTTGQMGLAIDMSVSAGLLRDSSFTWEAGDPLKTSGWYLLGAAVNEAIWQFGTGAQPDQLYFEPWDSGTNRGQYVFGNTTGTTYTFLPRDTLNYTHFTTIGVTSTAESNLVYHDGILRETQSQTVVDPSNTNANGLQIGRTGTGGSFSGQIDELRFSKTNRDADWVATEENNQSNPDIFFSTSSVEAYQPPVVIDEATHNITSGGSAFNNLTFDDATTTPAFTEPSVTLNGDFTIATGTVSLPTGVMTVGGDFTNNGFFQHNNAEVEFTTGGTATITLNGTEFFNSFYDVTFDGSGTIIFDDANATATNDVVFNDGDVVLPSGVFAIGGSMQTPGGAFDANGGTVKFTSPSSENVTAGGSSFNDVIFGNGVVGFNWYDLSWGKRSVIEISPESITESLSAFPVYVDLSTLGATFWSDVDVSGVDIRVTQSDGQTEVPVELVSIDTVGETGELYFRANSLSNVSTSTFYLYYDNPAADAVASTTAFGAQNVWTNDYLAVYHFEDEGQSGRDNVAEYKDSTSNANDAEDDTNATGTTGLIGGGVEFDQANHVNGTDTFDHLNLPIGLIDNRAEWTISTWYQTSSGGGNDPTFVSGYGGENELIVRLENSTLMETYSNGSSNQGGQVAIADIGDGVWRQFVYTYSDDSASDFAGYFYNGAEVYTDTNVVGATLTINADGLIFGAEQDGAVDSSTGIGEALDGFVDEVRFSSTTRSDAWIAAEFATLDDPASFYSVTDEALEDVAPVFTLNEATTDVDGNVTINGSQLVAPTTNFTIGGSALNIGGTYDPNNATTTFDSNDLGETVAFGDGAFWNLSFNGVGGGWIVATNTVNNNLSLITGADYLQSPNTTMTVEGIFNNSFASSSTTWTDSTLVLSGGDYVVTGRLDSGDDYAVVEVSSSTNIVIWNSTISSSTISDSSSIYMPDYGLTNGELRIFGNYTQSNNAEYWSYNTDFDGTDISGSPRQVDVRIASGSVVTIETDFEIFGDSSASTTVDVLTAGTYQLIASSSNLSAQYFDVTGTGVNGFELLNGVTVGTFSDGSFDIASGTSAMTVDKSTVEVQPSGNYSDFYFNSIAGDQFNVTASGTPNGFWLFTGGGGDRYGESYDNDDGDPGAIQWDDSNYAISISGVVYADDGVTPETAPICNGVTQNVTVQVVGSGTFTAPCNPLDGSYTVSGVNYTGDPKIVTYLNSEATDGTVQVELMDEATGSGVGSPFSVTRPSVIDDSVLIAMVAKDDDPAVSPPAGWTAISTLGVAADDDLFTGIWYRVVPDAATEPTSYSFTSADGGEHYHYWIGSFVNVDTTTPIDVSNGWTQLVDDTTPSTTPVTTTVPGTYVLSAWYVDNDAAVTTPDTTDWDYRFRESVTADNNSFTVISKKFATATTTDTVEMTDVAGGRDPHVGTFALNPAVAATASGTAFASAVTQTPIGASEVQQFNDITLTGDASGAGDVVALGSISVTAPATQDGDVMIAVIGREDEPTITAPAGWNLVAEIGNATQNDMYSGVWYKIITDAASEPASYSFTNDDTSGTEQYSYWIGSYSNVDTSNVMDVSPVSWTKLFNANPDATASSITTETDNARVFAAWYVVADTAVDTPASPWVTLVEDLWGGSQNGRSLNVSTQVLATAGASGDADLSAVGTQEVHTIQFALRPTPISVATELTDMDLYRNRVIVRHEDSTPLSIADITFDSSDDTDLRFTVSTSSSPDTLDVLAGSGLYVWNDMEFAPNGEVTMLGGGNDLADGSMTIGSDATFTATTTVDLTVGGSMYVESGGVFAGASSTVEFTATNTAQQIGAAGSSTITFYDLEFTGVGGDWAVQTPIVSQTDILVSTGTVSGISDITVQAGSLTGDGLVDMTGGTVTINESNTFGGNQDWTFNNLTLGSGGVAGITVPATNGTTTIRNVLTISTAHFLDAYGSVWDLQGNGAVFAESGTFVEGTSTVRYSGATPNVTQTPYYNLVIDTDGGGDVAATAPVTGLQVLNDLIVGAIGTSTLDVNSNDPVVGVNGDVYIGGFGTVDASDIQTFTANGNWDNDGNFNANGGTVELSAAAGSLTIAAGSSSFATLDVLGAADYNFTENATATANMVINTGSFVLDPGLTLAVGGTFSNTEDDVDTDWTGTTLSLFSGTAFNINGKSVSDTYNNIVTADGTHPRVWNSTSTSVTTNGNSSLYSMNHSGVEGDLYIFGDLVSDSYDDHWSYEEDFDGTALGVPRVANVLVETGGSVRYLGGSLSVIGSSSATTTIGVNGGGTYSLEISGDTDLDMGRYEIRDTTIEGLILSGEPTVNDLSNGDFEVAIAGGSAMTVGGTVIDVNPAQEYNFMRFATTTAINAFNVTATGTSASAWRFVNVFGNLDGEAKDVDPGGDPGYLTWQDSAAIINISGNVYSDEGISTSAACDSTTGNVFLSINGSTFATTTCNGDGLGGGTGFYQFTGISYGLGNTLTVYIDNEPEKAVTVTQDPISSISGFDLYENRVIVKHESGAPMTIADMGTWDSDDDADVLFDVEVGATDTLVLPSDTKLIVWDTKEFEPNGNITVPGGGGGSAYDGTLELRDDAIFTGNAGEVHTVGGSLISGTDAVFTSGDSEFIFTSAVAGRTVDTNEGGFYDVTFNGAGDWTMSDVVSTIGNDFAITSGGVTLSATTTVGGSFDNTGGTFDANTGALIFSSTAGGNTVEFGGSDAHRVEFIDSGSWTFNDVNATATDSFIVATGTVTLPSGDFAIGEDFIVNDTVTQAGGDIIVSGSGGGNTITLNGSDLYGLRIQAGAGDYTLTDASAALLGDLFVESGTLTVGTGTLSIGGSFDATAGTFVNNSGTVLFNSDDTGEFIDPGNNDFYSVQIAGAGGGWTILGDATTTSNFTLSTGNSFTMSSGTVLYVGGAFINTFNGANTEWQGSNVVLDGANEYEINLKTTPDERYNILTLGDNSDISAWNTSATSTVVPITSSFYSQDHGGVDGDLYIFGDYHIATTTEYWSRATDFDGTALGSPRDVNVAIASSSIVSVDGGVLNMIGATNGTTTVTNQGSGRYSFLATSGTINADNYSFRNLDTDGLQMTGNIDVTSLDNGDFELAQDNSIAITLTDTTINANASFVINDTRFDAGGFSGGVNVSLNATTTNSWSFTGAIGDLWGEAFDVDGTDDCSSVRWDDSACLLTEQTNYRWRNDDGGEGAAPLTWYDTDWGARKRVRVINVDASTYNDVAVKLEVDYDADMQTDFDDLRFTDSSGTTTISYWIERFTTGNDATVWVKVPTLAADAVTELYMYYDNTSASDIGDPSDVFNMSEDFEDNNITEYEGDTGLFNTAGTYAFGGGYGLDAAGNESAKATDGIARFDTTVAQGEIIRFMQYVDMGAGSGDEVCTMFGVQNTGPNPPAGVTYNDNYAVCLSPLRDRVAIVEDVENVDTTGTQLATADITLSTGWYEVEVDWQTSGDIDVSVFDSTGSLQATTTANDTTYTSGGIGFTFWFQNGGWDSYVSWPRTDSKPTTYFGAEQVDGGASWAAEQDTATGGFNFGETARLRVGIENTGLDIENQNFRLEFAPKLTAPSCEAVSGGSFVQVPVAASCGSSALCMTTSASTTDGDPTTDHLVTDAGQFVAGEVVANTSNQTGNLDVEQNQYTELEYAINLTVNAVNDAYCFRVTDGGDELDSYALLPELTLAFDPVLDTPTLNDGLDITLVPGATTTVIASTTVTDFNGVADIGNATTTFYTTSAGALCTPDDNNCYVATGTACSLTNCGSTSCTLQCSADFQFHADPTDDDGGEEWFAFMEVEDLSGGTDAESTVGQELLTLRALNVQNAIGYGTVDVNQNTGATNPQTLLENYGNESIDVEISGTDMTDGAASVIPASQQIFATSTFDYAVCTTCSALTLIGTDVEVDLNKPTVSSPLVTDQIYWGIEVPFGTASNPHSGVNSFTAISDD